jgi:hypothetical protein
MITSIENSIKVSSETLLNLKNNLEISMIQTSE